MSTTKTWPSGGVGATPKSYSIPSVGEFNWTTISQLLSDLCDGAQATTFQKFAVRKATASPVNVSATSDCIVVSDLTTPGPVTITLPLGANKQVFLIGDGKGDAATNNVTVTPTGGDTIGGQASATLITNREILWIAYNAADTDWKIVGRFSGLPPLSNPLTTQGDLLVGAVGGSPARLAPGVSGTFLKGGTIPSWGTLSAADIPSITSSMLADNAVTSTKILDGAVGTTKVADGSITGAKLATSAKDSVYAGVSGDVTIAAGGVATIPAGTIVDADISATAAIAGSKVTPAFGAQAISTGSTINASSTITGGGFYTNGTVSATGGTTSSFSNVNVTSALTCDTLNASTSVIGTVIGIGPTTNSVIETSGNTGYITMNRNALNTTVNFVVRGSWASGGTVVDRLTCNSAGTQCRQPYMVGTPVASGSTVYMLQNTSTGQLMQGAAPTSSLQFKTDIQDLDPADADKLYELRTITYKQKPTEDFDGNIIAPQQIHYGFIAEWVNETLPKLVMLSDDKPYSVYYEKVTVLLVELMKKHKSQIDALEARIAALEAK